MHGRDLQTALVDALTDLRHYERHHSLDLSGAVAVSAIITTTRPASRGTSPYTREFLARARTGAGGVSRESVIRIRRELRGAG